MAQVETLLCHLSAFQAKAAFNINLKAEEAGEFLPASGSQT